MISKYEREEIRAVVRDLIDCCCNGGFATTTLSPPVDAPGEGDPTWLGNSSTGQLWHWDGNSWELISSGGGGGTTYFGVTALSPPIAAPAGDVKFLGNPTTGEIWAWDGGAWVEFITANIFGSTALNPPVAAPTGDEPTWLGNSTVGKIWTWNGSAWVEFIFDDSLLVHLAGAENITGVKTFTVDPIVPDEAYDATAWNGNMEPPTKNAIRDLAITLAVDSLVVHLAGAENITGVKTFTVDPIVPDEAYDATAWDGNMEPPTKNAIRDKIETLAELTDLDNLKLDQFGITIDGGGSVLSTGTKGYIRIPYSGTITGWTIIEASATPVSSSAVVDIWKDTYANYPPTVADTIFTTKPTLSSTTKNQNLAPTFVGAGATVTAGDMIGYNLDSVTSAIKLVVLLHITKN